MIDEPRRLRVFQAINSEGARVSLFLCEWRNGGAYLVTDGAAGYLADPKTGTVKSVDRSEEITLTLCRSAHRRLQAIARLRR